MSEQELVQAIKEKGVDSAAVIEVSRIPFDPTLRKSCTPQLCQSYGKNWGCPPGVGEIEDLIEEARSYDKALVYETVHQLEDSFDIEGIQAGGLRHKEITNAITPLVREALGGQLLQLSAGGCTVCERCAKADEEPCRFPEKALRSVSAYGIYVSRLAKLAGLKYNNGPNTVTMFGLFFYGQSKKER